MRVTPSVGNHEDGQPDMADAYMAYFAVAAARVWTRQDRTLEYALRGLQSGAVLAHVGAVLGLIPFELH